MEDLTDQLNDALADRYRLERELGHGGMATVFLAEDLKHHRRVAIKVLHPTTDALVTRGLWSAAAGDTTSAHRLLATVRTRSAADLARRGFGPVLLEAWIAARAGRWQDVVRDLGPAALQGDATGYVLIQSPPMLRWLVAEAYERLDRPDSAVAYFERAIASPPVGGTNLNDSRMAFSFGHRRLVLLYARMGRPQEARRHWVIFSETFTRPDPEMLPLVEEARAARASAEGMAKTARR